MRQKAIVVDTSGEIATVRVIRSVMCEGCSHAKDGSSCTCGELLLGKREMSAQAANPLGARPGEKVEIETDSAVVLRYAALVFLLPLLAFFLCYEAAAALTANEYVPWATAVAGFLLALLPAALLEARQRRRMPQVRIVARLVPAEDMPEDQA